MEYCKKDLAEAFDITTQALDKRLNKLNLRSECRKDAANRLWIPEEVAQKIADSYAVRLRPGVDQSQPDETDWKALYISEKQRNDQLSDELIALSRSNPELNAKVVDLLGVEKRLEQAERALELKAAAAEDQDVVEVVQEPRKSRWQRLKDAWRG